MGSEDPHIIRLEGMVAAAEEAARWTVLNRQTTALLTQVAEEYGPHGGVLRGDQRLLGLTAWKILRQRGSVKHSKARPE